MHGKHQAHTGDSQPARGWFRDGRCVEMQAGLVKADTARDDAGQLRIGNIEANTQVAEIGRDTGIILREQPR